MGSRARGYHSCIVMKSTAACWVLGLAVLFGCGGNVDEGPRPDGAVGTAGTAPATTTGGSLTVPDPATGGSSNSVAGGAAGGSVSSAGSISMAGAPALGG